MFCKRRVRLKPVYVLYTQSAPKAPICFIYTVCLKSHMFRMYRVSLKFSCVFIHRVFLKPSYVLCTKSAPKLLCVF
jgi:hypothetical protein